MKMELNTKIKAGKPSRNRNHKLQRAFGKDKIGFAALPEKVSNVKISRILHAEERGGCTRCFPHGPETTNASKKKNRRSWKNQRNKQWKN